MKRPDNLKVGDKFIVVGGLIFKKDSIVELVEDDGTSNPMFKAISGKQIFYAEDADDVPCFTHFTNLKPYNVDPEAFAGISIITKPSHYQLLDGVEVMDITEAVLDKIDNSDMKMTACAAGWLQQSLQYLLRCYDKGGITDIQKAHQTLGYALDSLRKHGMLDD